MTAHLVESTWFALAMLALVAVWRPARAARRHVWLLVAAGKFFVPWAWIESLAPLLRQPALELPDLPWRVAAPAARATLAITAAESRWLAAVWICGAAACLAAWAWRYAQSRPRNLRPLGEVFLSDQCREPGLYGLWRPVVVLPVGLCEELPPDQLRAVILHEVAHARRHDNLAALFFRLATAAFWFHPLLWWIERRAGDERERACDETVLESRADARSYAAALLQACRFGVLGRVAGAAGAGGSGLERRIEHMMSPWRTERFPRLTRWLTTGAGASLVVIPLAFGALSRGQAPAPPQEIEYLRVLVPGGEQTAALLAARLGAQLRTTAPAPYDKWIDEVGVLLSQQEWQHWEVLRTDAEREQFIEQFWRERDPAPNTEANEFKEEHYRRIRWSDSRHGRADVRSRTYVLLGPPDVIESHPSGDGAGSPAWEVWTWESQPDVKAPVEIRFRIPR